MHQEDISWFVNYFGRTGLIDFTYLAREAAKIIGLDPDKAVPVNEVVTSGEED